MAAMMCRLTVKELIELLKDKDDNEYIGHLFSAKDGIDGVEHQVLVFYEPIHSM